jgi:hypothetical protein
MLGLTSLVVLARVGLTILSPRHLTASNYLVFVAFIFYIAMCVLHIFLSPYMRRVFAVVNGDTAPYETLAEDVIMMSLNVFSRRTVCFGRRYGSSSFHYYLCIGDFWLGYTRDILSSGGQSWPFVY